MADIQVGHGTQGIKLFGTTIEVQGRQVKDEPTTSDQTIDKRQHKLISCPRCKSMETKFCYFNNYNVNQPRHFCKGCQRYWTAGGALRNVPVGAGRRKAKPSCRVLTGFSEGCLFDGSGLHQIGFDRVVVDGWHMADHGGFQHIFPLKRPRNTSGYQAS